MKPARQHKGSAESAVWVRAERLPTLEELAWLKSPEGHAVCAAMAGGDPADTPAAVRRWRQRLEPEHVAAAWMQVTLRSAARAKFSRADQMLFDRVALEQATDDVIAVYKVSRFAGIGRVVDFCCGIGGDTLALAGGKRGQVPFAAQRPDEGCFAQKEPDPFFRREVVAIDWSATRLFMAEHNAGVYGRTITPLQADAEFERPAAEAAHIDPDRRATGPRRHAPDASSPGLGVLQRLIQRYENVAVKFSPGADLTLLPFEAELEWISHHGECRQAVAWTGRFRQAQRRATVLPGGESVAASEHDAIEWPAAQPIKAGQILFEPDAAVIRANLAGVVARRYALAPIDPQIALLIGGQPASTTLLRPFRIIDVIDWSMTRARRWLAGHAVGHLDVKTRGFAARPEDIIRRLKTSGKRSAVLFLTRVGQQPTAILTERLT